MDKSNGLAVVWSTNWEAFHLMKNSNVHPSTMNNLPTYLGIFMYLHMWRLNMWNFSQILNSISRNRKISYQLNGVILEQPIKKWVNQQEQKKDDDEDRTWWCFFLKKKKIQEKRCEKIPWPSSIITSTKNHFKVL